MDCVSFSRMESQRGCPFRRGGWEKQRPARAWRVVAVARALRCPRCVRLSIPLFPPVEKGRVWVRGRASRGISGEGRASRGISGQGMAGRARARAREEGGVPGSSKRARHGARRGEGGGPPRAGCGHGGSHADLAWSALPGTVLQSVMGRLGQRDLGQAACVSREWRAVAEHAEVAVARATGVVRLSGVGALVARVGAEPLGPAGGWDGEEVTVVDVGRGSPNQLEGLVQLGGTLRRVVLLGSVDRARGRELYAQGLIRLAARLPLLEAVVVDPERTLGLEFTEKDRYGVMLTHSAQFMDDLEPAEMNRSRAAEGASAAAAAGDGEGSAEGQGGGAAASGSSAEGSQRTMRVNRIFHIYPAPKGGGEPAMQGIGDLMRATEQFLTDRATRRARGALNPNQGALDEVDRAEGLRELRMETWAMAFQLAGVTNLDPNHNVIQLPFDGPALERVPPPLRIGWGEAVRSELTQMDRLDEEPDTRRAQIRAMRQRVMHIRQAVRTNRTVEQVRDAHVARLGNMFPLMARALMRRAFAAPPLQQAAERRPRMTLLDIFRRVLSAIPGRASDPTAASQQAREGAPRGAPAPPPREGPPPAPEQPIVPPGIGMRSTLDGLRGTSRAMHQEIRQRVRGLRSPQQMLVLVSVQMDTNRVMRVVSMVGDRLLCTDRIVEVFHPLGEDVGAWKLESLRCRALNTVGQDDMEELGMGPARAAWESAIAAANAARNAGGNVAEGAATNPPGE